MRKGKVKIQYIERKLDFAAQLLIFSKLTSCLETERGHMDSLCVPCCIIFYFQGSRNCHSSWGFVLAVPCY